MPDPAPSLKPAPGLVPAAAKPGQRRFRLPALTIGIVVSVWLHALVLSAHFSAPERPPPTRADRGLEIVLVNARHERAPEEAQVLAQANLDGGGQVEEDVRPSSPLPPQETRQDGEEIIEQRKRQQEVEAPRAPVMTTERPRTVAAPVLTQAVAEEPEPVREVSGMDLMDSAAAIARVEASVERRLEELAKRPRRRFIGARAREYRFAQYVEDWRMKVERVGTLNYPDAARGRLYGSLLLLVSIRADGSIEEVEVRRSSGSPVLDEAAMRIVHLAAPYAPFPPDVAKDTDIIEIVRTWTFTNSDRLQAQ